MNHIIIFHEASLARRPIQLTATQNMQMQMINALASILAVIDHHTKPLRSPCFAQLASDR